MARGRIARLGVAAGFVVSLLGTGGAAAAGPQASAPSTAASTAPTPAGTYEQGRVLVRYRPWASSAQRGRARDAAAARDLHAFSLVPGLELVRTDLPVPEAISRLEAQPGVIYAEPDYAIHAAFTPNDPLLPQLWGLDQPSDVDIDAKTAWNTTNGAGVTVAVIDSGIDLVHPDLKANVWTNPGEIAGNGIDDDDDGYVDDVHGWDFVDDDNVPQDEFFHGTHVAGTIAAAGNNAMGVVGVAYGAKLMPLRILDANGDGLVSDAVRAIEYASRHGVRVSNNSWGYTGGVSQPLYDAIRAAGDAGQLVVVAAGNDSSDIDTIPDYPASYDLPNILSVAAESEDDQLALFSNYGAASVDVAAPGVDIVSTVPNNDYESSDGTSMATPHVTGVAALVLAVHPTWTVAQVKARIMGTVRPVAGLEGLTVSGGMVNAAAAVAASPNLAPVVKITAPATGTSVLRGTKVTFTATAVDPEQGNVASTIDWVSSLMGEIGTGPTFSRSDLDEGTHTIVAIARDAAGHTPLAAIQLRIGPEVRSIDQHADPRTPSIAVAPDGTPVVAWAEQGVGVVVSRLHGSTWSRERVTTSVADRRPDVAVWPDGTVRVALGREWSNPGALDDNGILVARDDGSGAGSGWSVARVSEACGDDADGCGMDATPSFAVDASGRAHVAWSRFRVPDVPVAGNGTGLWHAVEHADGTWTTERAIALADGVADPDLATGPGDSAHVAYARYDAGNEGIYYATDETGSWVETRLVPLAPGETVGWTRIAVTAADQVDVAWGSADGVFVRTRSGGSWAPAATVTTDPAGDVDLVRAGPALRMVIGRTDDAGTATGMAYATSTGGGPWTITELDAGQDTDGRIAVDGAGNVHVTYLRAAPEHEVRYVTDATGAWVTDVVATGSIWQQPAFAVDQAGVRHVAVGRYGESPGVWYGTDAGGHWTLSRLTQNPPDGPVSLAVAPDGTASVAYAEYFAADATPLPDRAVWVRTGKPGAWTTTRIADNTLDASPSIARDAAGHLHVAFGTSAGGFDRLEYATNASGGWVVQDATPGAPGVVDQHPSIAVDAAGRAHIAFEYHSPTPGSGTQWVRYATNSTGTWASTTVSAGNEFRTAPSLALDPSGRPRIAFWLDNGSGAHGTLSGVRLSSFNGSGWSTTTISTSQLDSAPSVAVDAAGHAQVLYARSVGYAICSVPLCSFAPGLRYWSDAPGFGAARRVTDNTDDAYPVVVRGLDGSISGAFADPDWRLAEIRLQRPLPTATAPVTRLASKGTTLPKGMASLSVSFSGTAARYRLSQSVDGAGYLIVGSVSSSTSRGVSVKPGLSTTRRFRVTPYDGAGAAGVNVYGAEVRAWTKSERASSALVYKGSWSRSSSSSYVGGAARSSGSSSARATFRFTAREVAWVSAKGSSRGRAKVYVDGAYAATVNLHSGKAHYRRVVFRRAWSSAATHTISIRPVGNGRVDLDGFELLR